MNHDLSSVMTSPSFEFSGTILRKKNVSTDYLKLTLQEDGKEKSTTIYMPRNTLVCAPSDFNFLHANAVIHVRGCLNSDTYPHVTECHLVRCAPNVTLIKEILGLPNYGSFAAVLGMGGEEQELQRLVDESQSRKVAIHRVVEALTGKPAKAPPRYRPGRVRRADMEVLERKEAEGRGEGAVSLGRQWRLRPPRRAVEATTSDAPVARPVNLPAGAEAAVSAHGKLTRAAYLDTKKNRQADWFVARLSRLARPPARLLDVGGGRGDLAVRIAVCFPEANVVVVDKNGRSVAAGREYASRCGVDARIDFICADFADYVADYAAERGRRVDGVVALHACGDLSDMALTFAAAHRCDFVICPCCYPKRYLAPFVPSWHCFCTAQERDALARLAELDDHREVSRRAMLVVNSMRQAAFEEHRVELEEFDSKISGRNIALVGVN